MKEIESVDADGVIDGKSVSTQGAVWRRLDNEVDIYFALWGEERFFTEEEIEENRQALEAWILKVAG